MPATLEKALQTHLAADAGVSAITSSIWFGNVAPQRETLPDILFRLADGPIDETFDGNGEDLQFLFYEFEARSWKPTQQIELAEAVRVALRSIRTGATIVTTDGNVTVEQVSLFGYADDDSEFEDGGKARTLYSRTVLANIGHRIST